MEKSKRGRFYNHTVVFDVEKFIAFDKLLKEHDELKGIPLIPGLMPITTYKVFNRAAKLSHASIPKEILKQVDQVCHDDNAVKALGVDILSEMIDQIDKLTTIKGYHFIL